MFSFSRVLIIVPDILTSISSFFLDDNVLFEVTAYKYVDEEGVIEIKVIQTEIYKLKKKKLLYTCVCVFQIYM